MCVLWVCKTLFKKHRLEIYQNTSGSFVREQGPMFSSISWIFYNVIMFLKRCDCHLQHHSYSAALGEGKVMWLVSIFSAWCYLWKPFKEDVFVSKISSSKNAWTLLCFVHWLPPNTITLGQPYQHLPHPLNSGHAWTRCCIVRALRELWHHSLHGDGG